MAKAVTTLSLWAALLAGAIMVGMVAFIMVEIVLRTVFGSSTFVVDEFVGYGLAALTSLGLGYTLAEGGLLRVALLLERLPPRWRRPLELLGVLGTLAVAVFLGVEFWRSALQKYESGTIGATVAEVPLWIPEAIVTAGFALFVLQLAVHAVGLVRGGGDDPPRSGSSNVRGARSGGAIRS